LLEVAMDDVLTVKAMVATPIIDSKRTVTRLDRKLPNEATIISRLLKIMMDGVHADKAMVATPINDPKRTDARVD
jgi:hypothetical protein